MKKHAPTLLLPAMLVLVAALWRLVPALCPELLWGWANFAPVGALAVFGVAHLRSTWLGFALPMIAMATSDALLGLLTGSWEYVIHGTTPFVYGAFGLCGLMGLALRERKQWPRVLGVSLASSLVFFLLTNFGAWATMPEYYSRDIQGLFTALEMGIPFYKGTIVGDMLFTALLFGAARLSTAVVPTEAAAS
jgi:hypothetical protein